MFMSIIQKKSLIIVVNIILVKTEFDYNSRDIQINL